MDQTNTEITNLHMQVRAAGIVATAPEQKNTNEGNFKAFRVRVLNDNGRGYILRSVNIAPHAVQAEIVEQLQPGASIYLEAVMGERGFTKHGCRQSFDVLWVKNHNHTIQVIKDIDNEILRDGLPLPASPNR